MAIASKGAKSVYAGLSITHSEVEIAIFSPKTLSIEQSVSIPLPEGLFDNQTDTVNDFGVLKQALLDLLKGLNIRPAVVHVSLPATLLRMVEMPKIDASALYLSLSSEAERYKTFDNTEATVDFVQVSNPALAGNLQQLVLGAVRRDVLGMYMRLFKDLKIKTASISLEPVNVLRGLAASGVLDSLVQQIGVEARWGMILVESGRIRFSLWQGDRVVEMRELLMDTHEFSHAQENDMVVDDLLEEMRRTTKNEIPVLWLTTNMPPAMAQVLSQRLKIPVKAAPMGDSIGLSQPIQLSTLGVTTSSMVPFPFNLDLQEGLKKGGGKAALGGGPSDAELGIDDGDDKAGIFIPIGAGVFVLCAFVTGVLYLMGFLSGQGLPELHDKVDNMKGEIASLKSTEQELKSKVNLNSDLQEVLRHSKARTRSYVALTDELREKIPADQVWIQNLKITGQGDSNPLEITGKSLDHESVMDFARSYDNVPYTSAVLIDSIKEMKIGSRRVYDFKISGSLNLTPILAEMDAAQPEQTTSSYSHTIKHTETRQTDQPAKTGA